MLKFATFKTLTSNSRFYILASSMLLSLLVLGWVRLEIVSDQLFSIRLQQVYGLLCLIYWYIAIIISPVGYIVGKQRMKRVEFARRAIGVSAAYFALLHVVISLFGQLGGISKLIYLPPLFQWSLIGGLFGLIILLIMAATSFDKVIRFMTFRRWKLLHRLVYIAGILVILHIWTIGTHVSYSFVQISALIALALLFALETFRTGALLQKHFTALKMLPYFIVFNVIIWSTLMSLVFIMSIAVDNYHGTHQTENGQHQGGHNG